MAAVVTYDESVQRGQVGQPSPEPVSRTAPPVTTSAMFATSDASAARRSVAGLASQVTTGGASLVRVRRTASCYGRIDPAPAGGPARRGPHVRSTPCSSALGARPADRR